MAKTKALILSLVLVLPFLLSSCAIFNQDDRAYVYVPNYCLLYEPFKIECEEGVDCRKAIKEESRDAHVRNEVMYKNKKCTEKKEGL
jgi:hypothetical protein